MNLAVKIHTLGCRLNRSESESIASAFEAAGFRVERDREEADAASVDFAAPGGAPAAAGGTPAPAPGIVIINTCTVTSKAEQKARRLARLALRDNPSAVVIVTGCYAELDAPALAALGERVVPVPGSRKDGLLSLPGRLGDAGHAELLDLVRSGCEAPSAAPGDPFAFAPGLSSLSRSRASLKVEDGCDNSCSFCRVRLARGPSASIDPRAALSRARELEASGFAEIVLTGVNLSQYSAAGLDLPGLLETLLDGTERIAFRLSSYEPDRVDAAFLRAVSRPRVRPFFHLPVQSGSPSVLARMGRDPDPGALLGAIEALRRASDDPFISLDMICGFPGEGEADFSESLEFARRARPAWIHVFPYSPRPGTRAASFPGRVPERVADERCLLLQSLAREGRSAYARRWFGREAEAVLEGAPRAVPESGPAGKGRAAAGEAFTANALRVELLSEAPLPLARGSALRLLLEPPASADFDASAFILENSCCIIEGKDDNRREGGKRGSAGERGEE